MASVSINMQNGAVREGNLTDRGNENPEAKNAGGGLPGPMQQQGSGKRGGNVTFSGENMTSTQFGQYSASSSGKVVDSGSILGSAKNISGTPEKHLNEDSIVDLPDGYGQTDLATAIHLGYVERDPSTGGYREVAREAQQAPSNPQAEAQTKDNQERTQAWKSNPVDQQTVRAFDEFDMVYGQQFTDAVLNLAIDEVAQANETPDLDKFNQYASRAGMDPQQFMEKVQKIVVGFEDQAQRYIARNHPGVNGKEVMEWLCSGIVPADNVREVFNHHIHQQDLRIYDNVVKTFLANKDSE